MLNNKSILITGGIGSFGKAFQNMYWNTMSPRRLSFIPEMSLSNLLYKMNLRIIKIR